MKVDVYIDPTCDNWNITCGCEIGGRWFRENYVLGPWNNQYGVMYAQTEAEAVGLALKAFGEYLRHWAQLYDQCRQPGPTPGPTRCRYHGMYFHPDNTPGCFKCRRIKGHGRWLVR